MDTHVPYRARPHVAQPPSAVDMAARKPLSPTAEFFKGLVWRQTRLTEPQKRYNAALYDDNVRYADEWIGRLCDRLRKLNLYQNTLIIITADHGEEFWDHGGYEHGRSLYDEVLRVPLLIKFPRAWRAGERCPSLAGLIDLLPTVMDVVRQPVPRGPSASSGQAVRGESLVRLVRRAGARPDRRELFAEFTLYGEELKGLRTARYKVIFQPATTRLEVYDLRADPEERRNLAGDARVAAVQRRRLLEFARASERRTALWARAGGKEAPLDERTRESLRSIGYMAR
jgi:arylsulfatase A-like enzyme